MIAELCGYIFSASLLCSLYAFPSLTNYGAIPQTYENPDHTDEWTNLKGDGDPIDVCEIGTVGKSVTGGIYSVKILGALGMIDGGETDWKLLAIRTDDPMAESLHDIKTAPQSVINLSDDIRTWFRTYKVPEGKGENEFSHNGKWLDRDTALAILNSTHKQWHELVRASRDSQEEAERSTSFGEGKVVAKGQFRH
jgi:inorganic pyrophosphatase